MQSGFRLPRPVLFGPVSEPPPKLVASARFNGLPSRSDHDRLQNRETAPLPKEASPRKRPRGCARLLAGSAGLRAGVAAGFSRSKPPAASPQPPPPPKKDPHSCKIAPTPPVGNLSFVFLSPFLSILSPASPPERAASSCKMRIETGRDTDHRTSPPNFPGQFGLLSAL